MGFLLTENGLLEIHAMLYGRMTGYRKVSVFCKEERSGGRVEYVPPENVEMAVVHCLIRVNEILSQSSRKLDCFLAAAVLWAELLIRIHPFPDGNGRVVRYLTGLLLSNVGYQIHSYELLLTIPRSESMEKDILSFQSALLLVAQ